MGGTPLALPETLARGRGRAVRASRITPWWSAALALPLLVGVAVKLALDSEHLAHPGLAAGYRAYLIGVPMLIGLAWWWRRPASAYGPLLVVLGLAAVPLALESSDVPALAAFGVLSESTYFFLFVYLLVAFPKGRLVEAVDRWLVVGFAASAVLFVVPGLLLLPGIPSGATPIVRCAPECPDNPFHVADAVGVADASARLAFAIAVAVVTGLAIRLARRLHTASGPQRREVTAVTATALPLFPALVALSLARLVPAPVGTQTTLAWIFTGAVLVFSLGFLAALVQAELFAGAALRRLLAELAARPAPSRWRRAVAAALGDPSVRIGYWDPVRRVFRDDDGRVLERGSAGDGRRFTAIDHAGAPVAAMTTDEALGEQPELLNAAAQATLIAVRTGHLEGQLRDSRLRLLEAGNAERRRIQRDLHDSAQQRLIALRVHLALAGEELDGDARARAALEGLGEEVDATIADLRRVALGLFPPTLERHGVAEALRAACRVTSLPVQLVDRGLGRQSSAVESTLYFCCLEALQNAAKHAGPGASASVRLGAVDGTVWFAVEDDGAGFDLARARGTGLVNLRDRVTAMGGRLDIDTAPGRGTRVLVQLRVRPDE